MIHERRADYLNPLPSRRIDPTYYLAGFMGLVFAAITVVCL